MAADKRAARLGVLALVGTLLFSLVGARLWFLQTVEVDALQEQVDTTKLRTRALLPQRGRIFDADGRILADNQRSLAVTVDWELLRRDSDREEIFRRLSGWVDVAVEDMERRYERGITDTLLPMPVAEGLSEATAIAIKERVEDLPGVEIVETSTRTYPYAPLASHVVGYMGAITAETKDLYVSNGYTQSERVGQFGIELSMERELHGVSGYVKYEVDNTSRIIREVERVPPVNGRDIQLTIDLDQQQYAEQALETQLKLRRQATASNPLDRENEFRTRAFYEVDSETDVKEYYPEEVPFKAPAGAVVVQNWETGHIIALASYPTFDNRWFESDLSGGKFEQIFDATDLEALEYDDEGQVIPESVKIDPDRSTLVNRAIQGRYNLGSTFKPFTAYAALSTDLLSTTDRYKDEGTYRMQSVDSNKCASGLVRCVYKNATCGNGQPCVYGSVDVETALAVSSDAFFYRVGELIMENNEQKDLLQRQVGLFGFGERTGIDLPFEYAGTVPDRKLKEEYARRGVISDDEGKGYFTGDNVQLAIGQGLLSATPLQLATGYSTIANFGFVMKPEIIKAVYEAGVPDAAVQGFVDISRARFAQEPNVEGEVIRQIPMPANIHDEIDRGLRRVVQTGGGNTSDFYHSATGEKLFFDYPSSAIPVAGKTGTAQGRNNFPWNDSSAFTAYSIDSSRPYTVSAYLEKSGYGATAAGPVVKCMFLQMSGIAPADAVEVSAPLNLDQTFSATPKKLADTNCFSRRT
ncbi:MAG: penicillin-binding transpeptidase domain-containing protein [Ilumatobacter sp.]|nr:penicillin-binding transpeptidase domain-containing protein [Ilumatobacter sp.]MDG2439853.1 penicillin-binding transpeptidase domain-containing protein [Ilumatobacter sp.]